MRKDLYRSQFRLPWSLYEKLESVRSGSLNNEIVARLEASFVQDQRISELESAVRRNNELIEQMIKMLSDQRAE